MSTDTAVCEPCALRDAGKDGEAEEAESIRTQRLLLAFLRGQSEAVAQIASEVRACRDCMGRLAARYLSMTAGALAHICGDAEKAAVAVEKGLLEDLTSMN